MAFIQDGVDGTILAGVESGQRAQRVAARPMAALGHYSMSFLTGILPAALGANSEIFQFRHNAGTGVVAVIKRVRISASVTTTMFAAGVPLMVDLIRSISWSAVGTGGTGITIGANGTRDTTMGNSAMVANDIRIATTAALGAGTKTLDTVAQSSLLAGAPITASLNGTIFPAGSYLFYAEDANGFHPLIIRNQQGVSVRSVQVPATGTWQACIVVEWAEVAAYPG